MEVEEPLEMEEVKGFTCVVDVMDATSDGTLEQLWFNKRPWKNRVSKFICGHMTVTTC